MMTLSAYSLNVGMTYHTFLWIEYITNTFSQNEPILFFEIPFQNIA